MFFNTKINVPSFVKTINHSKSLLHIHGSRLCQQMRVRTSKKPLTVLTYATASDKISSIESIWIISPSLLTIRIWDIIVNRFCK